MANLPLKQKVKKALRKIDRQLKQNEANGKIKQNMFLGFKDESSTNTTYENEFKYDSSFV